ncbi:MAG: hypothetical protein NTX03_02965 [Bacteroidetes bacterium]|nr:hypothetical protein [Bacteroidota bacterium]
MNDFDKYYNGQFRNDLQRFFATIPDSSKFHDSPDAKTTMTEEHLFWDNQTYMNQIGLGK